MRLQHEFVVPLSVSETRRLVTELERYAPMVPGLDLRVTVHARDDDRSATVRLAGELRPGGGVRRAVVVDLAARLLREYARRVQAQARERTAQRRAEAEALGADGSAAAAVGDAAAGGPAGGADESVRSGRVVRGPTGAGSGPSRPRGAARRGDVWSAVTDPIGPPGVGPAAAVPVRRTGRSLRSLPALPVTARDVAAVAGVAAAVAVIGRAVRRRRP